MQNETEVINNWLTNKDWLGQVYSIPSGEWNDAVAHECEIGVIQHGWGVPLLAIPF